MSWKATSYLVAMFDVLNYRLFLTILVLLTGLLIFGVQMVSMEPAAPVSRIANKDAEEGSEQKKTIFRDIRRYYCEHCGICRSKKSLIRSHILSHHKV